MTDVRVTRGGEAFVALGKPYGRLCADIEVPIYSQPLWLESWAAAHPEVEPVAVVVGDADACDAAVMLGLRRRRCGTEVMLLGGDDLDLASLPARTGEAAARLGAAVAGVVGGAGRPWRMRFAQVPPRDPVVAALAARLVASRVVPADGVPVARVGTDREPGALLSKSLRYEVRRMGRRLAEAHSVTLGIESGAEAVARLVEPMVRLRRERDHDLGRSSTLDTESGRRFFREVLLRHAAEGRCEIGVLRVDGDLACYVVGLRQGATYVCWDQRIATAWAHFSPGKIVYVHVIEHALSLPECTLIDFGRGEGETKLRYANDTIATEALEAWSAPLWRRVEDGAVAARARAKRYKDDHAVLADRYATAKRALLRRRDTATDGSA